MVGSQGMKPGCPPIRSPIQCHQPSHHYCPEHRALSMGLWQGVSGLLDSLLWSWKFSPSWRGSSNVFRFCGSKLGSSCEASCLTTRVSYASNIHWADCPGSQTPWIKLVIQFAWKPGGPRLPNTKQSACWHFLANIFSFRNTVRSIFKKKKNSNQF